MYPYLNFSGRFILIYMLIKFMQIKIKTPQRDNSQQQQQQKLTSLFKLKSCVLFSLHKHTQRHLVKNAR